MSDLKQNLLKVKEKIRLAEQKAKRAEGSVQLCAVSKTVDHQVIASLHACGQRVFAENRPQSLRDKALLLDKIDLSWHFIGPLQSNKIKYVYPLADLVHSIDRRSLLEQFIAWQQKTGRFCPVLLQVHISGEEAKQGFAVDEILGIIAEFNQNPHLDMRGLMGMAPFVEDESVIRSCFAQLRKLFEQSRELEGPAYKAEHLSIGMSGDYEIAIAEGATMVRIGSALFAEE